MSKPFYITTPLYYVNAKPHIGHAYTNIVCDTFARFHRFLGEEVRFMTGTDEHGTKIDRAAKDQGKDAKVYVDEMVPLFQSLWNLLGIQYDYFIRTTDDNHHQILQNIFKTLEAKGDIYRGKYKGWYCTPCESFWTETQLAEGKCPDCHRDVQQLAEDNYFFRLSKYQSWLVGYLRDSPRFVWPETRRNEILSFLERPLEDLCITRPRARLTWGIAYPSSPEHVVYVWFDALVNYVSGVAYSKDMKQFSRFWPADLHVVGKDILRQHAIYWPIMLKAIDVEMPRTVLAHGWWTIEGSKVSKSRGNVVDPFEIVKRYGADAFRYYLLHEARLGLDGSYSEDLLVERLNSDLADDLGNLVLRATSMLERYFSGRIPDATSSATPLRGKLASMTDLVKNAMLGFQPYAALDAIWEVVREANRFVEQNKPWVLAKENKKEELGNFLVGLLETVRLLGLVLTSFLPSTAEKILSSLGINGRPSIQDMQWGSLKAGVRVEKGVPLFPKVE
ncbi:MAG: methionine--tRNA ligase [Omnitrophica bacterium RIFCSPLOWO2_12_FULL_50_11]|nr:MAG: methionine--tRNA ligase [Omnitrophica bacterium RIFCSPLOWO2_12_FULL_50_11]